MHADDAARMREPGGELGDRQRRRVGGEDALGRDDVFEAREELALRRGILDDRLDDELRDAGIGQRDDGRDPRDRGVGVRLRKPALGRLLRERLGDALAWPASAAPKRASCSWTR